MLRYLGSFFIFINLVNICLAEKVDYNLQTEFTLEELLTLAEKHNPSLQLSETLTERLDGRLIAARSNFFPNLVVDAGASKTLNPLKGETSQLGNETADLADRENWRVKLLVDQKIYTGGRNSSTHQKAKDLKRAEQYRMAVVKNQLFFELRELHARYLLAKVNKANASDLEEKILAEIKRETNRHQAGKSPEVYVLRLELALSRINAELISFTEELESLKYNILELVGLEEQYHPQRISQIDFLGDFDLEPSAWSLAELQDRALKLRPEIKRFGKLISAATAEIKTQRSRLLPDVSVFAGYGIENSDRRDEEGRGWKVGISGKWAIFDSSETKGLVKAAKAEESQRYLQKRQFLLRMERELRKSFNQISKARDLLDNSIGISAKARKALKQVEARYSVSSASQLDVLEAQVTLYDALKLEANSFFRMTLAKALLGKATGEGSSTS